MPPPVPPMVKQWCARRRRYLIAGAKEYLDPGEHQYYNTAVVIGPDGQEVFKQVKSVPIQFFKDGLPAPEQKRPVPKLEFPIVFEDEGLLVIDKPAGTAVHGGSGVSFGVIEALRAARPEARFLELAHRLDRDTDLGAG